MSLEAALDEERREIMALLEGKKEAPRARSAVGSAVRTASPAAQSPVRSMLDLRGPPAPTGRHASIAGPGVRGITNPTSPHFPANSSMLNPNAGPPTSPPRSGRAGVSPSPARPAAHTSSAHQPENAYKFEMLPGLESNQMPLRVAQGGKKKIKQEATPSMEQIMRATGGGRARHNSLTGLTSKSMSPPPQNIGRTSSPSGRTLNNNSLNLKSNPTQYVTDSGKVVDMNNAYRRLSDAKLLNHGGTLGNLAKRKASNSEKGSRERLQKDELDDDDEDVMESSDEERDQSGADSAADGDDDERRGRAPEREKNYLPPELGGVPPPRGGNKSLLAAVEDERKQVSARYKVQSLLEPTVTITGPNGEKIMSKRTGVHPSTSFDQGGSGVSTPVDSDAEHEISEIQSAQQLKLTTSAVHSSTEAHRCIRQIIRGDYDKFQDEAHSGLRRQRVYLVATDLSDEAEYALEWTFGTVLRDGDTLLALYAVDEELGTGAAGETPAQGVPLGGGASAIEDTASVVKTLSNQQKAQDGLGRTPGASPMRRDLGPEMAPDFESMDKAEKERYQATIDISERCVRFLRKTKLQVRVVIEVFHCKSPKHMVTEVIDYLEPTLVILGSRGRSALKGVLLGSFSNYLVTKSCVPVMVARKRLRKHNKYKRTNLRLSNNLNNPQKKLQDAKID